MIKNRIYQLFFPTSLFFLFLIGLVPTGSAQVTQDTLKTNRTDIQQKKQQLKNQNQILRNYIYDRSTHKYLAPENKRFNVPTEKEYYHPPITAQESLNAAMKVLRNQLENSLTSSRFYRILTKIAPFINNVFVFGYYNQFAPMIGPANPYLYPQTRTGQAWRDFMIKRHFTNPLDFQK